MADSPVRIRVELEGIEPNDRFQAALDELAAAAAELVGDDEVAGYLVGDDVGVLRGGWSAPRAGDSKYYDGSGNHLKSWSWGRP